MNAIRKTLQTRFALHVAARLDERAAQLAPHVAQRLKFAREQAIQKAHAARATSAWLRSGRRVAFVILMGALLHLASSPAVAADEKAPRVTAAFANSPGMITLQWAHSGEGVYWFVCVSPKRRNEVSEENRVSASLRAQQ